MGLRAAVAAGTQAGAKLIGETFAGRRCRRGPLIHRSAEAHRVDIAVRSPAPSMISLRRRDVCEALLCWGCIRLGRPARPCRADSRRCDNKNVDTSGPFFEDEESFQQKPRWLKPASTRQYPELDPSTTARAFPPPRDAASTAAY